MFRQNLVKENLWNFTPVCIAWSLRSLRAPCWNESGWKFSPPLDPGFWSMCVPQLCRVCVCVCVKFQDSRLCGWRFGFPSLAGPRLLAHVSSQHSILIWWVCTVSCALTKEESAAVVSSGTASSGEETSPQHSLPCVHEKEMR